jgi:hypothetical protein
MRESMREASSSLIILFNPRGPIPLYQLHYIRKVIKRQLRTLDNLNLDEQLYWLKRWFYVATGSVEKYARM